MNRTVNQFEDKKSLKQKIKECVCLHDDEVVFEGLCEYQKGAREIVAFKGKIVRCKKCGREKFIFPKKKGNEFLKCIPLF